MAVKLRTRLFLVVGALLAASVLVSAFLSRQLTLVEVREFVTTRRVADDSGRVLASAAAAVSEADDARLAPLLATVEEEFGYRVVVFDASRAIVTASNATLARARVKEMTPEGTFVGTTRAAGGDVAIVVRGAPTREVRSLSGDARWVLILPPMDDERQPLRRSTAVPGWVWTTLATVIVAVPLVFAVSRRILDPVSAMTAAARRMRAGDLDVQVEARGGDELGELARAFNGMAARLAENERLRKQMVSDVAHELRSPVTNLRCTLEAIQDGLAVPDRASVDALHEETLFLQRLIADLEELALADAGQLTLRHTRVDLGALLGRVIQLQQSGSGAAVCLDADPGLPAVPGDPDRLEQVFRNLLVNARTHTPTDGRIEVRAVLDGASVRVDVTDDGAGIEAAHVLHVFDRFYRADSSRSRATGGAGLGLAIARQLVTAHGGTITVHSAGPGQGATFTVLLPTAT